MDLSQFEAHDGTTIMEVLDPATFQPATAHDGTPMTITVVGMDSPEFLSHQRRAVNKRLAKGTRSKITAEQIEAEATETLAACIKGWTGFYLKGEVVEYSPKKALELMRSLPHLRRQVDEFIGDTANFMKTSEKSS